MPMPFTRLYNVQENELIKGHTCHTFTTCVHTLVLPCTGTGSRLRIYDTATTSARTVVLPCRRN